MNIAKLKTRCINTDGRTTVLLNEVTITTSDLLRLIAVVEAAQKQPWQNVGLSAALKELEK
jgi:hypothetical protein